MSNYFQDFPVVDYYFGDEETTTRFQHLGTAVDILEQVKICEQRICALQTSNDLPQKKEEGQKEDFLFKR